MNSEMFSYIESVVVCPLAQNRHLRTRERSDLYEAAKGPQSPDAQVEQSGDDKTGSAACAKTDTGHCAQRSGLPASSWSIQG